MILLIQSWKELKDLMSYYVGIVRTDTRLKSALDRLGLLYQETENLYLTSILSPQLCELRNLNTVAYLVSKSAQSRKESRDLHHNTDFQEKLAYLKYSIM